VHLGPGVRIGSYELESCLGTGAFGVVWLAQRIAGSSEVSGGERVAIKVLHPQAATSHEVVERFRREAWALSQLKSPHVARMYEFFVGPSVGLVLVMEYIEGELLSEVLRRTTFPVEHAINLGIGILRGVAEMQAVGIIHRDIKPGNVILRPNPDGWHAVIFDFNLSRIRRNSDDTPSVTATHAAIGSIGYMAPEQLIDARRVTESADVYSVGTLLFRAVTGELPFSSNDGAPVNFQDKLHREAPPLSTGRTDAIALAFETIVARSLRRKPAQRYPKAQAMLDELSALAVEARGVLET